LYIRQAAIASIEPVRDGRIFIELINWPFLHDLRGIPAEYKAGLDLAISRERIDHAWRGDTVMDR
jgi:hypothetical protein